MTSDSKDGEAVAGGDALWKLKPPDQARLKNFPTWAREHNPFIRRIVRRTRHQLETQIDPETGDPFLKPIRVELHGDGPGESILLPGYLCEAYELAEEFCRLVAARVKGGGFLKTLLLRRVGSSMEAGRLTAERMLGSWTDVGPRPAEVDDEDDLDLDDDTDQVADNAARTLTAGERDLLERFAMALEANQVRDPKAAVVLECLRDRGWLELGCIVFSQYRDSIRWLADYLTAALPDEPIALYSGPSTSGIMRGGVWTPKAREDLKGMVRRGELRLMLGTDAASEGLNLQKLARLINLDLPWNPTRLEQRKGRIQRIGQVHDTVEVYNLRYKGSVEDRVHEMLSSRLQDIHDLFGQIPDVLEDVWVEVALGDRKAAEKVIAAVPTEHPFEARYTRVEKVDWESTRLVLDEREKRRVLERGW